MLLEEIATVSPGYHLRGSLKELPEGDTALVQMSDIQSDGSVQFGRLSRLALPTVKPDYLLREGEVLITNRGFKNEGVLIDAPVSKTVAASHFYRVRLNGSELRPDFLAWYINQPAAQRELARYKKLSSIPLLSVEGIRKLPIPAPPLDVQEKVAAVGRLQQKEAGLMKELAELKSLLVSSKLMDEVSSYEEGIGHV
jgi:hypothetical protein